LQQYALLLGMVVATVGLALSLGASPARWEGSPGEGQGRAGDLRQALARAGVGRYHVRYYGYALLFLAFDMEMAFMYPWAVVYKELGLVALLDMGVFLMVLFLGLSTAGARGR
jgi:NADH-quinone oxidoreductase subunit A